MTRSRYKRGFTTIEMMSVLLLLAAIGLVLSRLFLASMRVIDQAPRARDQIVRVEAMMTQLRDDVWHAADVRVSNPRTLIVDQVTWTISRDDASITRTQDNETRHWKPISADLSFAASPSGVTLVNAKPDSDADDSMAIGCHAKLLAGSGAGGGGAR